MREFFTLELKGNLRQGGFMPLLWRLVSGCEYVVSGYASYTESGVELCLEGEGIQVMNFLRLLPRQIPGFYHLTSLQLTGRKNAKELDLKHMGFQIKGEGNHLKRVRPDYAPCGKCIREAMTPESRRYHYAFFSCKDCGPAYSIANRSPLLRGNTSMTAFPPCGDCRKEQEDPADPHHHGAELLTCPKCGPENFVLDIYGDLLDNEAPLSNARKALASGETLAIQSVSGGFRLLVSAFEEEKIQRLRRKKKNPDRPFCLLFRNMETIFRYCECSEQEAALLQSPQAPCVLLRRKRNLPEGVPALPSVIVPDTELIGAVLPGSMMERLLFEKWEQDGEELDFPDVFVTCGDNFLGHAECLDIDEIFNRLMSFTDRFLCHDLKTGLACPLSICQIQNGVTRILRRARGYVPDSIENTQKFPTRRICAAFGSDAHASVALGSGELGIVPSQELGNIASAGGSEVLPEMLHILIDICDTVPRIVVSDMERESFSARSAAAFAEKYHLPLITVQVHHAQALACMAEHRLENALGIVFTSGKWAPDETLWGAECIEAHADSFNRYASFKTHKISGWKNNFTGIRPAKSFLEWFAGMGLEADDTLLAKLRVSRSEEQLWRNAFLSRQEESMETHSAESLFAAVTTVLGMAPDFASYPGRCRGILENLALLNTVPDEEIPEEIQSLFRFTTEEDDGCRLICWEDMLAGLTRLPLLEDDQKPLFARAFYLSLGRAVLEMAQYAATFSEERRIVLSGEIFADSVLSPICRDLLSRNGFTVYQHEKTSPDASSVCIGQAYAALLS